MTRRFLMAVTCAASATAAAAQSPAPLPSPAPAAAPAAPAAPPPAASPSPAAPPYTPASPDPARGAALLKKAVAAHGGAAAIDAVRRLELKGASGRTMPGQDPIEMASQTHMVLPGLYRNELVTQAGPIATLLNADGAFVLLSGGALPLPEAEAAALRATANRNLMVLLRTRDAKAAPVARVGTAKLGEDAVEMVEFDMSGQKTVLAIDTKTGLVRQAIYTMPMAGGESRVVATYSDYRTLSNGAKYPFKSLGTVDGKPVFTSRLDAVVVNGDIADALFTVPAPPAPGEPLPWASPSPSGN
jgi:hypothetical protein